MAKLVRLRAVSFDTNTVGPGQSASFFHDRSGDAEAVTNFNEPRAVEWLLGHDFASRLLLEELGISGPALFALGAVRPFTTPNEKPGDVDVLVCDPSAPHRAVALECKRIKVVSRESKKQRVNRLEAFRDGYIQANGLRRIGFSRSFLTALAVADARADRGVAYPVRGADATTFQEFFDVASTLDLEEEVGLLYIEISQPVAASVDHSATIAMGILREALPVDQTEYLTAQVTNYLREHGRRPGRLDSGLPGE